MAKRVIFTCDKCGVEESSVGTTTLPKDWQEVSLVISTYDKRAYALCFNCRVKLGLVTQWTEESVTIVNKNIAEKLLEVIEEVVSKSIDERI